MKLYVASSWRNERYPFVLTALRHEGFDCYDFRNPAPGNNGFQWSAIDPQWQQWSNAQYLAALHTPTAQSGFAHDYQAMQHADGGVLVLPSGRSAHIEAGWIARSKPLVVLLEPDKPAEPELMYLLADVVTDDINHAVRALWSMQTFVQQYGVLWRKRWQR